MYVGVLGLMVSRMWTDQNCLWSMTLSEQWHKTQIQTSKFFFTNVVVREWNKLPPSVVQCNTVNWLMPCAVCWVCVLTVCRMMWSGSVSYLQNCVLCAECRELLAGNCVNKMCYADKVKCFPKINTSLLYLPSWWSAPYKYAVSCLLITVWTKCASQIRLFP